MSSISGDCLYKSCDIISDSGRQCIQFAVYETISNEGKVYKTYALSKHSSITKNILLKVFSTKDSALCYIYELLLISYNKINRFKKILM